MSSPVSGATVDSRGQRPGSRSLLPVVLVFGVGFLARIANLGEVFGPSGPRIGPFDDLYHALRITYSVGHPGQVLGFDPGRGPHGAFCPWPPLYDVCAGGAARLLGARDENTALGRVVWFPPLLSCLFAAAVTGYLARRFDSWTGVLGGLAIALSPPFLQASRLGAIDHHFLEPPLLAAILVATVALSRSSRGGLVAAWGALFGSVLALALFVQPAMLLAAAAALAAVLLLGQHPAELYAAACGFFVAAAAVLLYAAAQPTGYPENSWYLGVAHAAALAGAGAAGLAAGYLAGREVGRVRALLFALPAGALVAAAFPGAVNSILSGARFLRGDPWLETIVEFQPLFFRGWPGAWDGICQIGGGALLLLFAMRSLRTKPRAHQTVALFSFVYLAAALASQRFLVPAAPLIAIAGALLVTDLRRARRAVLSAAAAVVLLGPGVWGTLRLIAETSPPIGPAAFPILRAAQAIQAAGAGGRVLASWSWGHVFHIVGDRPVVVDGFGASIGETDFQNALGIVLSPREDSVASYCRANGIRFVVLQNPLQYLTVQAQAIGLSPTAFVRTSAGRPEITPLMRFSFWWRAYFDRGAPVRETVRSSPAFSQFQLRYADTAASGGPKRFLGPAVEVWELVP